MRGRHHLLILVTLAVGLAAWTGTVPAKEPAPQIKLGMLTSMFRDVKPGMVNAFVKPFYSLVESQIGLKTELVLIPSADELRQQMDAGTIQFGVYHGFEFAWMQQKTPALQPLMIAAPIHRPLQAFLVVHTESTAQSFADLKGLTLALPTGTREHTRLFAERNCLKAGKPILEFFKAVTNPTNPENGLHDVADNKDVKATIVDGAAIQCFNDRNPGRAKRIKIILSSEIFPEGVVAYQQGKVDADVVRRFREAMSSAHSTQMGKQLMTFWSMSGFLPIPPQYPQHLADIARAYPAPGEPQP